MAVHDTNEAAFHRAKQGLCRQFPKGHFVEFEGGQMVADAPTFDALTDVLAALGKDRPDVFVAQVGVAYPDEVFILL